MATKITDTKMISDETRHTAAVVPGAVVEGGPTAWSVTWLPGRLLTLDQAIDAMMIAEVAATHEFALVGDAPGDVDPIWLSIDGWAAKLGISGPHALAEASLSPEDHEVPRGEWPPAPAREIRQQQTDLGTEAAPGPCGLCKLRAERGVEPPPGGCTCQAVPVDYAAVGRQLANLRQVLAVRPGEAQVLCQLLDDICGRLAALETGPVDTGV